MRKLFLKTLLVLVTSVFFSSCLEEQFEEIQDETQLNVTDLKDLYVSDPAIWNTLANQSILLEPNSNDSNLKSAQGETEYPGGDKYYFALFEDLYPGEGDYDFNDIVLRTKLYLGSNNESYSGTLKTELVHRGGSAASHIGIMFYDCDGKNKYQRIPNEDIRINGVQLSKGGDPYTIKLPNNVSPESNWEIDFSFKKGNMRYLWINYFLITNQGGSKHKIASAGFANIENSEIFKIPTSDYLTNDNKPWGLEIESREMPIVIEKENFCKAFPNFINWVKNSNNALYKKWHENPDDNFIQTTICPTPIIAGGNPDFENDFSGWTQLRDWWTTPENTFISTANPYHLAKAVYCSGVGRRHEQLYSDITRLTVGQDYQLTFYAAGGGADFYIGPSSDVYEGLYYYVAPDTDINTYKRRDVKFKATNSTMRIWLDLYPWDCEIYVDNFSIAQL